MIASLADLFEIGLPPKFAHRTSSGKTKTSTTLMSKNSIDSLMPVLIAPGHPSKIIKFDHVAIDLSGSDDDSFGKLATVRGIQKINDEFENSNLMVYDLFLDSASSFSFKVACSSIEIAFALLLYLEKRILNKKVSLISI